MADHPLNLNQGTLYPALVRLEQKGWIKGTWQRTESNREAKYYAITKAGLKALEKETERWRRLAGLVDKLLARRGGAMTSIRRFVRRVLAFLRPGRAEDELAREIASHRDLLEDDLRRQGLTREEARAAARRAFLGVEAAKDAQRDARSFAWLEDARRDVRYAVRMLAHVSPGSRWPSC